MNNKQQKTNRQLSLELKAATCQQTIEIKSNYNNNVISFPTKQDSNLTFRERIKEDLIRNRIIVD